MGSLTPQSGHETHLGSGKTGPSELTSSAKCSRPRKTAQAKGSYGRHPACWRPADPQHAYGSSSVPGGTQRPGGQAWRDCERLNLTPGFAAPALQAVRPWAAFLCSERTLWSGRSSEQAHSGFSEQEKHPVVWLRPRTHNWEAWDWLVQTK